MAVDNRIYAGTAGGKRYFHGENGKLFDEAGVEQPVKLATILKANFPPPPPQATIPNPAAGRAPPVAPVITVTPAAQATAAVPPPVQPTVNNVNDIIPNSVDDYDIPDPERKRRRGGVIRDVASHTSSELLRIAFPDLFAHAQRYRNVINKAKAKNADPAKKTKKKKGEKASADKKRNQKELSLKIGETASHVRTNGELQRQQLTLQTESVTLLEKISRHAGGGDGKLVDGIFGKIKSWLMPTLGLLGVVGAGAGSLWLSHKNKEHTEDIINQENIKKYGVNKAEELEHFRNESTLDRMKEVYKAIPETDKRRPRDRANDQAKKYDKWGRYVGEIPGQANTVPGEIGDTNKETKAIAEAANRKPSGKVVDIKGDTINFEARTIRLDAKTLTINATSSSSGTINATSSGAKVSDATAPRHQQPSPNASDGRTPAQSVFRPDVATPSSPGASNPKAPGYGGITGGQGATEFGGRPYNPKATGTAEAIRQNDIAPTQSFKPPLKGANITQGDSEEGSSKKLAEVPYNGTQASVRYNNPGASWPSKGDEKFGIEGYGHAAGNNLIGKFPTPVHGMAANMNLLSNKYVGMTVSDAISKWSGNNRHSVPGFEPGAIITSEMAKDPKFMLPFFNEMRKAEGSTSKMTGDQIQQAFDMYKAGSASKYMEQQKQQQIAKQVPNANAQNTGHMIGGELTTDMLGDMFSSKSIADMKAVGGVHEAAKEMETKATNDAVKEMQIKDDFMGSVKTPKDQSSIVRGDSMLSHMDTKPDKWEPKKYTDELKQKQLDSEGGWLWQHGPQGRNRKQQLSVDPWQSEPGYGKPIESINPVPGEIPSYDESSSGSGTQHSSDSSFDDPVEKSEGSHSRITDHVQGAKKPKPIRKVDIPKYYPQYPKSDFGDQSSSAGGISVA